MPRVLRNVKGSTQVIRWWGQTAILDQGDPEAMNAHAAGVLAIAVGHSLPNGLIEATAEIERLRAQVADLQASKERLERENSALEQKGREGRMHIALGPGLPNGSTWREQLVTTVAEIDRLDSEADMWYEKYARVTRCPPGRSRAGPYVRPSERR